MPARRRDVALALGLLIALAAGATAESDPAADPRTPSGRPSGLPASAPGQRLRTVRIGFVLDGPWDRCDSILASMKSEILDLVSGQADVRFPEDKRLVADWTANGVDTALRSLLQDPTVDLVVALGVLASDRACRGPAPSKPVVAPAVVDAQLQGLPSHEGTSGVHNLSYLDVPSAVERDLQTFRKLVPFERLAIFGNAYIAAELPALSQRVGEIAARNGIQARYVGVGVSAARALASIPDGAQAVYILPLLQLPSAAFDSIATGLVERRLPSFSALGDRDVRRGVLIGVSPDIFPQMARRLAVTVQRILAGEDPGTIPTGVAIGEHLEINARTARAIGWFPSWAGLSEAELIDEQAHGGREITLVGAMREALVSNLDLAAAVRQTRAGSAAVGEARSPLLPQVDASVLGLEIDADRAATSFGTQPERTITGSLDGSQILFSEDALAAWSIQRHLQRSRTYGLEQDRLDTSLDAGKAYLDLLSSETQERIRKENLQLTRSHLEIARLLLAVGATGPSDVYRWESEMASNRRDAILANALRNISEIELNRVLHHPLEEPFVAHDTGLDDPELWPGLAPVLGYFADKSSFRVLRDFMVKEGLELSPELQSLDAQIAASRRQLDAATRAFYLPSVGLQASWSSFWAKDGAGTEPTFNIPGVPRRNDTDWSVGVQAGYPLLRGGGKLATRARVREELGALEVQRQSSAERLEDGIRSTMHRAGALHAGIQEARAAADWARKNLDLVTDSYSRGAATFVTLLDAQNAHVVAERTAANAVYDFLDAWLEVQRAVGRFDFTMTDAERAAFLEKLSAFAAGAGATPRGR